MEQSLLSKFCPEKDLDMLLLKFMICHNRFSGLPAMVGGWVGVVELLLSAVMRIAVTVDEFRPPTTNVVELRSPLPE